MLTKLCMLLSLLAKETWSDGTTDALKSQGFNVVFGNNVHLSLEAESKEEADKLFNGLSEGGKVVMPIRGCFLGGVFWCAYR